jgi:IclR family KDG regulon transcriptional repressor
MDNVSVTVDKAIDILEVFLRREGEVTLSEMSDAAGLNPATAFRLLSTLARRGYVKHREKKGAYSLGLKMLEFNYAVRRNLKYIDLAYLAMSKLSKQERQSVYMAALDADHAIIIEEVGVTEDLIINSPVGKRLALYCTACGKVLLAGLSDEERKAYYRRNELRPITANTVIDAIVLEQELDRVRLEGVAFDNEEYRMGLWIAASPFYDGNRSVVAAVGIMVPTTDVDAESIQRYTTAIKSCTAMISQLIGRIS